MDHRRLLEQHHRSLARGACRLVRVRAVLSDFRTGLTHATSSLRGRARAREEIPAELRRDVRLLGELLGQVIADSGGARLLRDVERLRRYVIRARDEAAYERHTEKL